jgi:hypothetical protein
MYRLLFSPSGGIKGGCSLLGKIKGNFLLAPFGGVGGGL